MNYKKVINSILNQAIANMTNFKRNYFVNVDLIKENVSIFSDDSTAGIEYKTNEDSFGIYKIEIIEFEDVDSGSYKAEKKNGADCYYYRFYSDEDYKEISELEFKNGLLEFLSNWNLDNENSKNLIIG